MAGITVKPVSWIGSSYKDFRAFPDPVQDAMGYALYQAQIGAKHVPNAARYVRRYLEPLPELFTGEVIEPDHDVITELWFDDEEQYAIAMLRLAEPDIAAEIVADEELLFDRSKHRVFLVDERDSVISGK